MRERDRGGGGEREIDKGRERVSKREREVETGSIFIIRSEGENLPWSSERKAIKKRNLRFVNK